jgi:hypothetical protein
MSHGTDACRQESAEVVQETNVLPDRPEEDFGTGTDTINISLI